MLRAGYQGVMTVNTTQTLTRPAAPRGAVRRPEHPAVIAGTRPRPSASAGDVIQAYLRVHAHTLTSLESAVRADEYDSVHQMRVAVRRLHATLRTFDQVIPHVDSEHLDTELQWLGRVLGHARDAEVLAGHLRDSLRPTPPELLIGPVLARVQGHYAPRRADARAALLEALGSPRYARLLAELDRVVAGRRAARRPPPRPVTSCRPPSAEPTGRPSGGCAAPGTRPRDRPGTLPCTRPASRPAGPATPPRRRPRPSACGAQVRQGDEAGPVGARRPP